MFPTADDIARAIVAACGETGEDPLACASQEPELRARHYAMHALAHCFPTARRGSLARVVGAPGNPAGFWNNSKNGRDCGRKAAFWSDAVYDRVIRAVEAHLDRPAMTVPATVSAPNVSVRKRLPGEPQTKADLYRMLGEAVANTARLPKS